MPPQLFEPNSIDSMFATILAQQKGIIETQEKDQRGRAEFRAEMRVNFDKGAKRMDEQDHVLAVIKEQALKTNGRVTRIEEAEITRRLELLELAEITHKTETARQKGILWVIGGMATFLGSVASAVGAWWLSKH